MKNAMENSIEEIIYDNLEQWCLPNITSFSDEKNLFSYQVNAIKNAIKVLNLYYTNTGSKQTLFNLCKNYGLSDNAFQVKKYNEVGDVQRGNINRRYALLNQYYPTIKTENNEYVDGYNFFNRIGFWMATGSGKSIVIIKLIETLNYLQQKGLMPSNDIMILFPREDLIKQFMIELTSYNRSRSKKIELVNLKFYDEDKMKGSLLDEIKVYYYRSDLIRDVKTDNFLSFKDYANHGKWFVILDEAHKGEKEYSLMQDYVSILSSNGFLFNFSATFTDKLDYYTTCYNFNLEKFVNAGYGKNIYLSSSYFDFNHTTEDYTSVEKKKQVLKSLIVFTVAKKSRKPGTYHLPLLMTLVNSINTNQSDLLLFFKKIEELACGNIDINLLEEAKDDLMLDFKNNKNYMFGYDKYDVDMTVIKDINIYDILENVFNSNNFGRIEIINGEKGKEIILKLETSDRPFALIKIGDADKFQREKLGDNYIVTNKFENDRNYFNRINKSNDISVLMGSRSFYEGWDSNRPNVINLINIGGPEAKKFILQSIGRGIRIEPKHGYRRRLDALDENKNKILETLFVFATNKAAVKSVIEAIEEEKSGCEVEIPLAENNKYFDLLIPRYADDNSTNKSAKFNISSNSLKKFKDYFNLFDKRLLLIKHNIDLKSYGYLAHCLNNVDDLFQIDDSFDYKDMTILFDRIEEHITIKNRVVSEVKHLGEEIVHFKHIKLVDLDIGDIKDFEEEVQKVANYKKYNEDKLLEDYQNGTITREEFLNCFVQEERLTFKDLELVNLTAHYYSPLIYSTCENVPYVKHIIYNSSEVEFVKNLISKFSQIKLDFEWMFSKIDETLDDIYIPYFDKSENKYRKFYPDFIFWVKKKNKYKVVYVDPKGTDHSDYESKVDAYEKLFTENNEKKIFKYKNYEISFELKLITNDINQVGDKYKKYWLNQNDFNWLNI